jgi:flagellar hook-associated protein 1 FlgK
MAREINSLHRSGKTMGIPPKDGEDFFVAINQSYPLEMGNIKLNDNLIDLNNIVASASGDIGDNTIALEIANLKNKSLIEDLTGELSISEYYQSIILKVGYNSSDASRITDSQRKLVRSADINRQSIAGVSMDEEMTNMMKYKYAYNAASRAINVIDEMLESLITRMGIVGR